MSDQIRPDSTVEYTVKELLDEQTTLLRRIDVKVDGKADKADVVAIGARLDAHQERLDNHEARLNEVDQRRSWSRKAWAVAGSIAGIIAIIGGSLIGALVH